MALDDRRRAEGGAGDFGGGSIDEVVEDSELEDGGSERGEQVDEMAAQVFNDEGGEQARWREWEEMDVWWNEHTGDEHEFEERGASLDAVEPSRHQPNPFAFDIGRAQDEAETNPPRTDQESSQDRGHVKK